MTVSPVTMEVREGVAILTLNQPEKRNAVGPDLSRSLFEAAERCASSPEVRCVILTGAGAFFSVGGDVGLFSQAGDRAEQIVGDLAETFHAGVLRLAIMPKPLVTAINGPAAGAGLSLAILGDIAIADRSAQFAVAYTAIGLTPDGGASWMLPRLIGLRRAQEMILTNRRVSADEAAQMGLITRVVEPGALADAAWTTARSLADGATLALATCRRLLHEGATQDLESHLAAEARAIAAASGGAEGREGVGAFLAKRKPVFPAL